METVYLETSFISYLVSEPSRDVIVAGHQQITRAWWEQRRQQFSCCVSEAVWQEASRGDPVQAQRRRDILRELPRLAITAEVERLAQTVLEGTGLPPLAFPDAVHIAVAAAQRVNYLLTWNCKHIANAVLLSRLERVFQSRGLYLPAIATPEELMGENWKFEDLL
jgi:predicted nucleic acid-binding protein